tara:strand:- start:188 stop:1138 length:951 start_codon:yes stop_codon:yes gene_type:complete
MVCNSITVSAPGSMMLFGEHAVLESHLAIAMAIDTRLTVKIQPRKDLNIQINSSLGQHQTNLNSLSIKKPFEFILAAINHFQSQLQQGMDIFVETSFSHTKGFGSSAAITVATVAALNYLLTQSQNKEDIFLTSRTIIQHVQGRGSGTDALASTMGTIVTYQMQPLSYQVLPISLPISLIYCGYKTPTTEVIKKVNAFKQLNPKQSQQIFLDMHQISQQAVLALSKNDLKQLGKLMQAHQACQKMLGVSDLVSEKIIQHVKHYPVFGAKISGSGLGDCIAVLGNLPENSFPCASLNQTEQMTIQTAQQGVIIHDAC